MALRPLDVHDSTRTWQPHRSGKRGTDSNRCFWRDRRPRRQLDETGLMLRLEFAQRSERVSESVAWVWSWTLTSPAIESIDMRATRCAISAASSALAESLASGRSERPAARNRVTRGGSRGMNKYANSTTTESTLIILCTFRAHPTLRGRPPHNRPDASAQLTPCARGGIRTHTSFRSGGFKPPASANSATRACGANDIRPFAAPVRQDWRRRLCAGSAPTSAPVASPIGHHRDARSLG